MSVFSRLAAVWRWWPRKSAAERSLEQAVKAVRPLRLLAIGLGDPEQARRLIVLAQRCQPDAEIHFTGIDLFEERPDHEPELPLKDAYRLLRSTGARVRLVPGDPYVALVRSANSIRGIDLAVISPEVSRLSMRAAWFFVPRTLARGAVVLWADGVADDVEYRQLPHSELIAAARSSRASVKRAA